MTDDGLSDLLYPVPEQQVRKCPAKASAWAAIPRRIPGSITKTSAWVSSREAGLELGLTDVIAFRKAWDALSDAASRGEETALDGVPVRMAPCRIKGVDRWCLDRRDLGVLAGMSLRKERRWPKRPDGWLTLEEAVAQAGEGVDPDAYRDAWRALTKGTAYAGFGQIAQLGVRFERYDARGNERWLVHADDAPQLAAATKGRLPHLHGRYLPPGKVAARVEGDAKILALRLLTHLADRQDMGKPVQLEGRAVGVRRFLVNGEPAPCLAEEALPRFYRQLRTLHDEMTARQAAGPRI